MAGIAKFELTVITALLVSTRKSDIKDADACQYVL
jgi:hypothetical protein